MTQIMGIAAGNNLDPMRRLRRRNFRSHNPEIAVRVVDAQIERLAIVIDIILPPRLPCRDQHRLGKRGGGRNEADLAGDMIAGDQEDQRLALRLADRHAIPAVFLLVEQPILLDRLAAAAWARIW